IVIDTKGVTLQGSGGTSDWGDVQQDFGSAATQIISTTNAPILKWKNPLNDGRMHPGRHAVIRDLAIQGNADPVGPLDPGSPAYDITNNQDGIVIDNFGLHLHNVAIAKCGGIGLHVRNSVWGTFSNVMCVGNLGSGLRIDDSPDLLNGPLERAVNFNQF